MPKKEFIGVRVNAAEREALDRAAAADDRPISALVRKIVTKWLRENGWLKETKK